MNVYNIQSVGCYSQRYCVVADSMEEATKIWKAKYYSEPDGITIHSAYVLIQEQPEVVRSNISVEPK